MSKTKRARYQFYLDKKVADDVADMGKELGLTRSQLVRDAMSSLVNLYRAKRAATKNPDYNLLFKLSGIVNVPAKTLSAKINDIRRQTP